MKDGMAQIRAGDYPRGHQALGAECWYRIDPLSPGHCVAGDDYLHLQSVPGSVTLKVVVLGVGYGPDVCRPSMKLALDYQRGLWVTFRAVG